MKEKISEKAIRQSLDWHIGGLGFDISTKEFWLFIAIAFGAVASIVLIGALAAFLIRLCQ